ncbi:pullulanase-type alpha-1,6-glucosidase [Aliiglaciecola sp.]|nr:pullulanase-type alpha-1,6-glucosidase [Aliiglaciecola sp.]
MRGCHNHFHVALGIVLLFTAVLLGCQSSKKDLSQLEKPQGQLAVNEVKSDMSAHWLRSDLLVSKNKLSAPQLIASKQAHFDELGEFDTSYTLKPVEQPNWLMRQHPHLKNFYSYSVDITNTEAKQLAKQQLAVVDKNAEGNPVSISYVQFPILLDDLYTSGQQDADEVKQLGAVIDGQLTRFSIWAPTARNVQVKLYNANKAPLDNRSVKLIENPSTGIWSGMTNIAPQGSYYRYQVEVYHPSSKKIESLLVTDPYSLSLSTNSSYSQVVDLDSVQTQPQNWQNHEIPDVSSPEKMIVYETHIRDFSASDNSLSDIKLAGKYAAFNQAHSDGIKHLKALKEAGLNTIHLLPTYDITTVNEQPSNLLSLNDSLERACQLASGIQLCNTNIDKTQSLAQMLKTFDPLSADAQQLIEHTRSIDAFNWGYDPFHYTVPEGSYALNPEGIPRLLEFRQMVMRLHQLGFRVVMDVVYNHTFAAGVTDKSVLDKVVPGYYQRLNPVSGDIERSTCCENTATEHRMMAKLMIDSLVIWARDYKIDGFRFDLMGHQPKSVMLAAREAVKLVDPDTYFYGEGWNFGEVANNARFVQASQNELAGTQIGTFTDRLRDAIRGGSSFVSGDDIRSGQGLGNGLVSVPNELHTAEQDQNRMDEYLLSLDQARVGLIGNLAIYPLENANGERVFGRDIDYGGAPTGYALDPADTVNYVSKHDNQTLWDNNQYRIANDANTSDRVRMQLLSLAYPLMAQGIPFLHMGSELLRSKSYLRDSYDYGDWYNKVDFSKQSNNYNVGLPPADKDSANWDVIKRIIEQNQGRDLVSPRDIQFASDVFMDLIKIRSSTPLFSLEQAEQIIRRVSFHNTGPNQQLGLIVMRIDDSYSRDLDPNIEELLVIFNHTSETKTFPYIGAERFSLHPVQKRGADPHIKQAATDVKGFTIPSLSVAVFTR